MLDDHKNEGIENNQGNGKPKPSLVLIQGSLLEGKTSVADKFTRASKSAYNDVKALLHISQVKKMTGAYSTYNKGPRSNEPAKDSPGSKSPRGI